MGSHLLCDNAPQSICAVHLQMDLVGLVCLEIRIFSARCIIKDKLLRITFPDRYHVICDHFAHVDKRDVIFFSQLFAQCRITTITIVDCRRRIVITTANRAHDDGVRPLGTDIIDHFFHVGSEEILGTIIVIVYTELDDYIIAVLQLVCNAIAVRAPLFEEHVIVTDSNASIFVLAATAQRHAALTAVHHRSLALVKPVMKILALALLGTVAGIPILHRRVTAQIDSDFR